MQCPKCLNPMDEVEIDTLSGIVVIDRCGGCAGLWFDHGEEIQLKTDWMSDFVDSGDTKVGKKFNVVSDINCPRCGDQMELLQDQKQKHIQYEVCAEHGIFMDAGEFSDFKHETAMDLLRGLVTSLGFKR